jgi:CubicO group peptidase (beta-lactamase class C family)
MLANEHKLDLDDPLSSYLPEIPASWGKVTLRTMLNHQSGIPQFTTPQRQLLDLVHDYTDLELIQLASTQPLDFEPGTNVSYSDTGYVLLGFVVNRVSGMFYGDFLQQRVFKPLRMNQTRIISDKDIVLNRASGYERADSGELYNQTYVSPALNRTADGSLYSTVLDLMKWDRALYGDTVLPQAQLERMWRIDAHRDGQRPLYHFGYGFENNRLRGQRVVEYDGNWQGFQAVMSRYVDKRLTVIVLTNLSLCRTERLGHAVAGLIDPDLKPYPNSIPDSDPEKTARFREFLDNVAAGGELDLLSVAGAARLVPSAIHTLRRDLQERGPIVKFTLAEQGSGADSWRVYRAEEKDMVEFYTVKYSPDARIDDIDLLSEY